MRLLLALSWCFVLMMVVRCGGGGDGASPVCEPGETQTCFCAEGGEGVQICKEDGSAWDICQGCSAQADTGGDPNDTGDSPTDAGSDAPEDSVSEPDSGTKDTEDPDDFAPLYGACGGDNPDCDEESGQICAGFSGGNSYCVLNCEPGGSSCPDDLPCMDVGICAMPGTAPTDSICGLPQEGETVDFGLFCQPPETCVKFYEGLGGSFCLPMVESCDAESCPEDRVCLPGSQGQGICARTCGGEGAACPEDLICKEIVGGDWICVPEQGGDLEYGAVCSTNTMGGDCAEGLTCLLGSDKTGVCSHACEDNSDCPSVDPAEEGDIIYSICAQIATDKKLCIFACGQPGLGCPPDLSCKELSLLGHVCMP